MKKRKSRWKKSTVRAVVAAVLAITLCLQPCMSVAAGYFITDPATMLTRYVEDDGSFGEFQWVQIPYGYVNQGRWVYIGPKGYIITEDCSVPGPVIDMGDGVFAVDQRVRSAIGAEGQQPVFSVPVGKQRDLQYAGTRQMLDAIPLYPDATTGSAELDALLEQIFAQIITPDMDTHDKLKACYDYLITTFFDPRYEEGVPVYENVPNMGMFSTYSDASLLFFSGNGVCDNFSAAFAVMSWKLGVPMYIASGYTSKSDGGYTPHAWCQLDGADGTVYVFDPHIDYLLALRSGKTSSYVRFGAPSSKVAGKYTDITMIFDKVK